MTTVLIPKESGAGEARVAATPETVEKLIALGFEVEVESGAGAAAHFRDKEYAAAGARLGGGGETAWRGAGAVLKVGPLSEGDGGEVSWLSPGALVAGLLAPYDNPGTVRRLAAGGVTSLALELLPRVTRAQTMDALSSQASVAGYRAVLVAAARLDRHFPLLMTAAGTIRPARVVVIGAGVAGLQAVATARRLGAVVEVSDIRPAVKEQVESLGGRFIDLPEQSSGEGTGGYAREMGEEFLRRQRELLAERLSGADVVITTAAVPGKPAPKLVDAAMVDGMKPGSLILDLAAERGGNCELTRPGEEVEHDGVTVLGPTNLVSGMAHDASLLYSRNVLALVEHLVEDGAFRIDLEDEIVAGALLTHDGAVRHPAFTSEDGS